LKYKKCHWRREDQTPGNLFEIRKRLGLLQKKRLCLFGMGASECSSVLTASHSISKSASLRLISERSHVAQIRGDFDFVAGHSSYFETIRIEEISINKASTFGGFCDRHDAQLFAELDRLDLTHPSKFCWQLYYRAVAFEKFRKLVAFEFSDCARSLDKGADMAAQLAIQSWVSFNKWCHGEMVGVLTSLLQTLESIRARGAFDDVQFCCFTTDRLLPFAGLGCFQPSATMDGKPLQRVNRIYRHELVHGRIPNESVCIAAVPMRSATLLCLCFLRRQMKAELFVKSIVERKEGLASRFLGLMMMSIENVYFRPSYLRTLDESSVAVLKRLHSFGIGEDVRPEEVELANSVSFFDSVSVVDQVVGRNWSL
jgi:hypothetical protein